MDVRWIPRMCGMVCQESVNLHCAVYYYIGLKNMGCFQLCDNNNTVSHARSTSHAAGFWNVTLGKNKQKKHSIVQAWAASLEPQLLWIRLYSLGENNENQKKHLLFGWIIPQSPQNTGWHSYESSQSFTFFQLGNKERIGWYHQLRPRKKKKYRSIFLTWHWWS